MSEKQFWDEFEKNMKAMGLPAPNSLFSSIGTALGTVGAIANAIKAYGTAVTVSEVFMTIPFAASSTVAAAGASELIAIGGALSASFYLGACIGSLIIAANETYGDWLGSYIATALRDIADTMGMGIDVLIQKTMCGSPMASPIRCSVTLARRL